MTALEVSVKLLPLTAVGVKATMEPLIGYILSDQHGAL